MTTVIAVTIGFILGIVFDQVAWGLIGGLLVGTIMESNAKKKQ